MKRPLVAIGVPAWRAADFIGKTISTILRQREVDLSVDISIDDADAATIAACRPFLRDERVTIHQHAGRLGWVRNSAFVLQAGAAKGARYVAIHPHDDLMLDGYLAELAAVAEAERAAVTYSDLERFGRASGVVSLPSTVGTPLERQVTMLRERFDGVPYRGLTRVDALSLVMPMSGNVFDDFAVDTVWMARLATVGNLIRIPKVLYRKRYHHGNTHSSWRRRPSSERMQAWAMHCRAMLDEAVVVAATAAERNVLEQAAYARLLQDGVSVGPYALEIQSLSQSSRDEMLQFYIDHA